MSAPSSSTTPAPVRGGVHVARLVVIALLLGAIGAAVYLYFFLRPTPPPDERLALRGYLQSLAKYGKFGDGLADADGDLVADAPKDGKFVTPTTLTFTEVAGDNPEANAVVWEPFLRHLEQKSGLKTEYLSLLSPGQAGPVEAVAAPADPREEGQTSGPVLLQTVEQQIDALRSGRLHVAAFSTGQVPMAVNAAGFRPLFAPADADGSFSYEMKVIVPSDSPAKDVKDLKGKTVAFVSLSSNSGAKAPIVRFKEKFGLTVWDDYQYVIAGTHDAAIFGVCVGRDAANLLANPKASAEAKDAARRKPGAKYDAACVASDLLARLVASGEVKEGEFRVLHAEGPFPALCFGVGHALHPDLVKKIEEAFETFPFAGNSVADKYKAAGRVKFGRVDYKKDWAAVRDIDDKLPEAIGVK